MSLIYSDPASATLFWATFLAFVLLDGRIVVLALAGRATSEPTDHAQGLVHRTSGLLWIFIAEFVGFAVAAIDPLVLGWRWPLFVIGLALAWLGLGLRWWAKRVLGRFFVAAVVIQRDHRVVTEGPYSWIRHPGYAGMILTMIGLGIATGNVLSFVVLSVVPLWVIIRTIGIEERALASELGDAYVDYQRRTPRLAPRIW